METTELRIGNLVNKGKVKSIYYDGTIGLDDGYSWNTDLVQPIQPIPITEDWLLKFGFEKEENGDSYYKSNRHHIVVNETGFYYRVPGTTLTRIDFIHQLQNLYFALTGTELETKD